MCRDISQKTTVNTLFARQDWAEILNFKEFDGSDFRVMKFFASSRTGCGGINRPEMGCRLLQQSHLRLCHFDSGTEAGRSSAPCKSRTNTYICMNTNGACIDSKVKQNYFTKKIYCCLHYFLVEGKILE